jgi:hypothetical protein
MPPMASNSATSSLMDNEAQHGSASQSTIQMAVQLADALVAEAIASVAAGRWRLVIVS